MNALREVYWDFEDAERVLKTIVEYANEATEIGEELYAKYKKALWIGLLLPAIMELTGVTAMASYAPIIYEQQPNSSYLPTLLSMSQLVFGLIAFSIVGKFCRRSFLLAGSVVCSIAYLMCFVSLDQSGQSTLRNWIFNIGTFTYMGGFNMAYGPMTYLLINVW